LAFKLGSCVANASPAFNLTFAGVCAYLRLTLAMKRDPA
jgi:hypothetical protein